MSFMTGILIHVLFLMACAWNVEGKTFMKQRLGILESRVHNIEQDIVTVNASFIHCEDQVCECLNAKADNDGPIKQKFGQSVVASKQSETRIKKGLMDEKKWVRQKVKHVENEMHKVVNQVLEDNKNANAETVRKMQSKENDMNRKLNVAIAEVTKDCRDKIANQEENNENTTAEIMTKIQTIENEQGRKLNVAIAEVTKDYRDKIANQEENNKNITAEIITKIQTVETEQDRKLNVAIAEAMTNYSDKIRKRDMKIDEQQVEIDNLKQTVKIMKEVLKLSCPNGWTEFQSFCYLYVKERKNYDSARETCLKLEASVADIQSSSENDFVYKLCQDNGHTWRKYSGNYVWIGFSDQETEGVWISDRTRETSAYMNWRPGQPDFSTQDCSMMGYEAPYDQWNDNPCTLLYQFVCKKKLPSIAEIRDDNIKKTDDIKQIKDYLVHMKKGFLAEKSMRVENTNKIESYVEQSKKAIDKNKKDIDKNKEDIDKNKKMHQRIENHKKTEINSFKDVIEDMQKDVEQLKPLKYNMLNKNIALGKTASESSSKRDRYNQGAYAAIDGRTSGNFYDGSCTHTHNERNPWWQVDLGRPYLINRVVIANRADCCGNRLHSLEISVSKKRHDTGEICAHFEGPSTDEATENIKCSKTMFGRYVKIQKKAIGILTLCEVEIFAI